MPVNNPNPNLANNIKNFNTKNAAKYAAQQNVQAKTLGGTPPLVATADMSVADIALIQKSQDPAQALTRDEQVRLKALQTKENLKMAAQAQKDAEQEQLAVVRAQQQTARQIQHGIRTIQKTTEPATTWMTNLPTPGGIATLLIIILVFLMAIVPSQEVADPNNPGKYIYYTRLNLLWLTILGRTSLKPHNSSGSSGGSSNTNNAMNTSTIPVNWGASTSPTTINPLDIAPSGFDILGGLGLQ